MPFNSGGVYTPPNGAENAFPGQVIASATWNSIHTDMSTALTSLGEQNYTNVPRVISSAGNNTVNTTDAYIFIQANVPSLTLPLSSSKPFPVKIMGASAGIFGSDPMVILPTSPDTISGQGTLTLNANYQVATFYPLASGGYIVSFA